MYQMLNGSMEDFIKVSDFHKFCVDLLISSCPAANTPSASEDKNEAEEEATVKAEPLGELIQNPRRRGRKLLRPNDPLAVKSEIKDKFWLRKFRNYMRCSYEYIQQTFTPEEKVFWAEHLSKDGKPEKGRKFKSYSKEYKQHLFKTPSYANHFQIWFHEHGTSYLSKKCEPNSDLWKVYYDYVTEVLLALI